MKTRAIRLYGVDDIRLEEFDLPEIGDDEILVKVVSDSICMSTWKTVKQGQNTNGSRMTWLTTRSSLAMSSPVIL